MNIQQKTAILLLATSMLATPVWAQQQTAGKQTQGIIEEDSRPIPEEVRELLEELEEYLPAMGRLHVDTIRQGSQGEYSIFLSDKKRKIQANQSLSITTDENNHVLSLSFNDSGRDKTVALKKIPQEHFKKAVDFIAEHVSADHAVSSQAMLSNRRGTSTENLSVIPFYPVLNGIPVQKEMGQAYVDAEGQIVLFKQEKVKLPSGAEVTSPAKVIGNEKAAKSWGESLSMELVYDQESGKLVYIPKNVPYIDGISGQVVPSLVETTSDAIQVKGKADLSAWRDQKKLEQMLGKVMNLSVNRVSYIEPAESDKSGYDLHQWNSTVYQSAAVKLDRKTRLPVELAIEGAAEKEREKPLTSMEAKKMAVQFVENYLLDKDQSFLLKESKPAEKLPEWVDEKRLKPVYTYQFYPESNGISAKNPLFVIEVDGKKGNIVLARVMDVGTASFPDALGKKEIISAQEATQAFLKIASLRLSYWYPKAGSQVAELPQLVYLPTEESLSFMIDAHTGEALPDWLEWDEE